MMMSGQTEVDLERTEILGQDHAICPKFVTEVAGGPIRGGSVAQCERVICGGGPKRLAISPGKVEAWLDVYGKGANLPPASQGLCKSKNCGADLWP